MMLRRARSRQVGLVLGVLLLLGLCGCGVDHYEPTRPDGVSGATDGGPHIVLPDGALAPDLLPQNSGGPTITIAAPTQGEIVVASHLRFQATVTDKDGVDPSSVTLGVGDQATVLMTAQAKTPATYEALVDLRLLRGATSFWIRASDLLGNANSAVSDFVHDLGPSITFLAPESDASYKGSVKVELVVADVVRVKTVRALVGSAELLLTKKDLGGNTGHYSTVLLFDDPFDPPLSGKQTLTVLAENENGAQAMAQRSFNVDDQGPEIVLKSQTAGQIIGGNVTLEVEVTDPAGVMPGTVQCVVGDGAKAQTVPLIQTGSTTYSGLFDARAFDHMQLWPVMSFRASDVLGNESHLDLEVGLDSGPPILALSQPGEVYMGRYKEGQVECSHPFDPLGRGSADDLDQVPQVVPLRAHIEDQGNIVPSASFIPVAGINDKTVWLYVLDDAQKPLVVDTTGDGFCDSINPEVVPQSSVPQAGKAIAVNLGPVPVGGAANYTPWPLGFPFAQCNAGTDDKAPDEPLCFDDPSLPKAISYTADLTVPALYAIPPVAASSVAGCLGLPFDFGANNVADGWACVAAAASDNVGNHGVSAPLRLWVSKSLVFKTPQLPPGTGSAPSCTGTLNATTGKVNPNKPCIFRLASQAFPQVFPSAALIVEKLASN